MYLPIVVFVGAVCLTVGGIDLIVALPRRPAWRKYAGRYRTVAAREMRPVDRAGWQYHTACTALINSRSATHFPCMPSHSCMAYAWLPPTFPSCPSTSPSPTWLARCRNRACALQVSAPAGGPPVPAADLSSILALGLLVPGHPNRVCSRARVSCLRIGQAWQMNANADKRSHPFPS